MPSQPVVTELPTGLKLLKASQNTLQILFPVPQIALVIRKWWHVPLCLCHRARVNEIRQHVFPSSRVKIVLKMEFSNGLNSFTVPSPLSNRLQN